MKCVLDASLSICWCLKDEYNPAADEILNNVRQEGAAVPALWLWEIGNVLILAERKGRQTRENRLEQLIMLQTLNLDIDELATRQTWSATPRLADTYKLTLYDAAYLELALRLNLPLASLDRDLRVAAEKAGVVCLPTNF